MTDADYLLALKLQEELNAADELDVVEINQPRKRKQPDEQENLNATQNIVHPEWETLDPTPDVYSLFGAFDIKFFQGKLKCVELEWSKKMYTCAGICYQRRNRLGMSITIRLSEPLLKLRSRRDLIQTLLHEMIHAYLFILGVREPNGGHGPNFIKLMTGINKIAGTNITVYHSFHDEVNVYKNHVWRCNGICQHRKPFFGWVRRTCNRAPGPNDLWWARHAESCGGCFQKVSGPEPKRPIKKIKAAPKAQPKINSLFNHASVVGSKGPSKGGGVRMNGGSRTQVITGRKVQTSTSVGAPSPSPVNASPKPATIVGNLTNVVGFKDLNGEGGGGNRKKPEPFTTGGGHVLGSNSRSNIINVDNGSTLQNVRDRWASKYHSPPKPPLPQRHVDVKKEPMGSTSIIPNSAYEPFVSTRQWEEIDDDISVQEVRHEVIDISDNDDDVEFTRPAEDIKPLVPKQTSQERQKTLRAEIMDDDNDQSIIELIDDEYEDDLHNKSLELLTDTSVIDDIFGTDTLMTDFDNLNNVIMRDPENVGNPNKEIITCPICQEKLAREDLSEHLEGCSGLAIDVKRQNGNVPFYTKKPPPQRPPEKKMRTSQDNEKLLLNAGYSRNEIKEWLSKHQEEEAYNQRIYNEIAEDAAKVRAGGSVIEEPMPSTSRASFGNQIHDVEDLEEQHPCPVCNIMVPSGEINSHLDRCLQKCAEDDEDD